MPETPELLPYAEGQEIPLGELLGLAARVRRLLDLQLDGELLLYLPPRGTLSVASDIHGNLDALRRVFALSGLREDPEALLLLLGDYVDKGKDSVATIANILAAKLALPDRLFLLRGNHETRFWAALAMGLRRELRRRYGRQGAARAYAGLLFAFDALPLVALSENGLVAMHGGPPRSLQLGGMTHAVLHDVLWSDLHRNPRKGSRRGMRRLLRLGHGRRVAMHEVDHFLANTGKTLLLRGHSHILKGVEVAQAGNVMTIISANSLARLGTLFGRMAQRGLAKIDLAANLTDASQVEIRLF